MLILYRSKHEGVFVGSDRLVQIVVANIYPEENKTRLKFIAPPSVKIQREETDINAFRFSTLEDFEHGHLRILRSPEEAINIHLGPNQEVNVKVLGIEMDRVKLGFTAQREILILRGELSYKRPSGERL